jgi:hypothetical protein
VIRFKLERRERLKTDTRHMPDIKSNGTYEVNPQILNDWVEQHRKSLENSMDIHVAILHQFRTWCKLNY